MPVIRMQRQNDFLLVTLCRPEKANALNQEMVDGVRESIKRAEKDGCVAVVFRGQGSHFCSGFDLDVGGEAEVTIRFLELEHMLSEVAHAAMPTIACINGGAVGAGADLAIACTFRLGTGEASFRFPGPQFGVALGTRRLATLVGPEWSYKLLLLQETIGSVDALRIGLLSSVVGTPDDLLGAADALVQRLGLIDSETQRLIMRIVRPTNSAQDIGELIASISRPGLRARLTKYAEGRKRR